MNTSGIHPIDLKVLVKPDAVEEVSAGGIVLSVGSQTSREQMAQVEGTLIESGGSAFCEATGRKPEVGERVIIAKFAGLQSTGHDGEEYRLCNDNDIVAIVDAKPVKEA
jgi:co-chaperonin GroES (HSP10)